MKKEGNSVYFNSQDGKVNVVLLISFILAFLFYSMYVLGDLSLTANFPPNATNASLTTSVPTLGFNATAARFNCTVNVNSTNINISNVSLFIGTVGGTQSSNTVKNQTQWINTTGVASVQVLFNVTEAFNEGTYFWFCEAMQNGTSSDAENAQINFTTVNQTFRIDRTPPGFVNLTNTSNVVISTENKISVAAAFFDGITSINIVRLFVNLSGTANNEVNISGGTSGVKADNNSTTNLSFVLPGSALGHVLNFTLQVNDSVNNVNITPGILLTVTGDATPPGINLSSPINLFNQTSTTAPNFNFTAVDNNITLSFNLTCGINISLGGSLFANVSGIIATNGTPQINTTAKVLSNGTYTWNVSCTDPAGNVNTSLSRTFTVDQIAPVLRYFNITNSSTINHTVAIDVASARPFDKSNAGSARQGGPLTSGGQNRTILFVVANFTDNLTQVFQAAFQFFNVTSGSWQTLNTTPANEHLSNQSGLANFSFPIPQGHNEFEGANISFIVIANDTLGYTFSNYTRNITIQINDTTPPTVTINGTILVNGTNITDTRPVISWYIDENSKLTSINVSVDSTLPSTSGGVDGCGKSAFYSLAFVGAFNVEKHRNSSFQIEPASTDVSCPLANGTHFVNITIVDVWNNTQKIGHTFNVQSGNAPQLILLALQNGLSAIGAVGNQSNLTPYTGINFSAQVVATATLKNMSFTSSCNSTVQTFTVNSTIWPFNYSDCKNREANQTVTVTVFDTAGNSVTNTTQFFVDDLGPTISVNAPTSGFRGANNILINLSAKDANQLLSKFVYYLDEGIKDGTFNVLNASPTANGTVPGTNITNFFTVNFTAGTHTIKFGTFDTAGGRANGVANNSANSTEISITVDGPIDFLTLLNLTGGHKSTLANYINVTHVSNLTLFNSSGEIINSSKTVTDQTLKLLIALNASTTRVMVNVSIFFNASAANWDRYNFSVKQNDSTAQAHIVNNYTSTIMDFVWFNNSIQNFLPNNDTYYGVVRYPINISSTDIGGKFKIFYFRDTRDVTQKTNVTQCAVGLSPTAQTTLSEGTFPCWNNTNNQSIDVFVPHFSGLGFLNDTTAPSITINLPVGNQSVSMLVPNITVSSDAVSCIYQANGSTPEPMAISGTSCMGQTERFKNRNAVVAYNITFNATDAAGNVQSTIFNFNISDNTAPDNGIVTSSGTTTGATITITGANESVNVTVNYGTVNTSLTSSSTSGGTDFNATQTVTISGISTVSTATAYYYNVTVCDFNGNCKTNGTFTFTQTATAAAAAAAASTSSGGGGGGAAVTSNVAAETSKKWDTLAEGSSAVLTINNANIAVTGVVVDVKATLTNAEVKVASLTSNPLSAVAAAKVYQYLQLTKSNVADTDTSKITVNFRVPKSWLSSNSVAESDVVLYRYSDSKWNALPTAMAGSDANNVLYSATTPGFSTFAIGSKEAAPTEAASAGEAAVAPTEAAPATTTEAGEAPAAPQEPAMEKKGLSTTAIAWIVVLAIVVVAAIGFFMMQKKKVQ